MHPIIIPILQMWKQRHGEDKQIAWGRTGSKRWELGESSFCKFSSTHLLSPEEFGSTSGPSPSQYQHLPLTPDI